MNMLLLNAVLVIIMKYNLTVFYQLYLFVNSKVELETGNT